MKRTGIALLAVIALGFATAATAQEQDFSKVEIKTTDLGHNTYMLEGSGGNITVAVGDDAVLMVDSEYAPLHDKIKAAVAKITPKPIRTIVITHYHGDHSGGIAPFAKEGVVVIAQANVRKRLEEGATNALTGAKTPPVAADAFPTKTYTDTIALTLKGRRLEGGHLANAHTDGDTYVYFADANVLSTGDIVTLGRYPNVDVGVGGNIKGMIAAVDTYLKLSNDTTKIVPGHGPVTTKAALADYRAILAGARDRVQHLITEGKTEDEAVAAKPLADLDPKVNSTETASANLVRLIYRSLKS